MADRPCRWGILGTATIARKNWKAIALAPNATLTAVASRDADRARAFIRECQGQVPLDPAPEPLGGYETLLASDRVDAVYVPLPTGMRAEWLVRAAEAGKHVLGEKPAGVSSQELQRVLQACAQNRVQYMDGVMFMHSDRLGLFRQLIQDGAVGQLRRIATQFSFQARDEFHQENIRVHSQLEPLGCLGDLGWYNIRFTLAALDWQLPLWVSGRILSQRGRPDSPDSVPTEFSAELLFGEGVSASLYCSFRAEHQQWAVASGTGGSIRIHDFVLPYFGSEAALEVSKAVYRLSACDFNMEDHTRRLAVSEYSNGDVTSQETKMFQRFSDLALSGQVDPYWGQIALKTQQVLDACLLSARRAGAAVELQS